MPGTMLIVGATGVVGEAALAHFATAPVWDVVAVSRRTPDPVPNGHFRHVALDLTDAEACRSASADLTAVTHVLYAAVAERPGLVQGWRDRQQMQTNLDMLRNILAPLTTAGNGLEHVTLLQGAKAYGAHTGHRPHLPARERDPRIQHDNFYWLQEDYLRQTSNTCGFGWTIIRPQVVVGGAWGVAMNPLLPLGAYAALRTAERKPFSYPGGSLQVAELVDAGLLAEVFDWVASAPTARNETFNVTNGDAFAWRDAWPVLADSFGVEVGPDEPMQLATYLPAREVLWQQVVARHGLRPIALAQLLGESHHYADLLLRMDAVAIAHPTLLSTIKLRQAGFVACRDSEDVIRNWIRVLQDRKLIPRNQRGELGASAVL